MLEVSVIIPTFNRGHFIGRAIKSCLQEESLSIEIVVVDDGSTDNTAEIVNAYGSSVILHVLQQNSGAQTARNEGMKLAKGKYLKFLDSDDFLEPGSLSQEVALAEKTSADIVVSAWGSVSLDGHKSHRDPPYFGAGDEIIDDVLLGKAVHTSAALYRSSYLATKDVQWDRTLQKLDDWCFFATAALGLGRIERREGIAYWLVAHDGPRLTDASVLENAHDHHRVLAILENKLKAHGELSQIRRKRLAEYHFKELQVLVRYDRVAFEKGLVTIQRLYSAVDPRVAIGNKPLGWLAKLIGIRKALLIYAAVKS